MEPQEIANQLRCPNGAEAKEVAQQMNKANQSTNHLCIDLLQLSDQDKVLEIGPGNGAFAARIVNAAQDIHYTGVDWSADMVSEAKLKNEQLLTQNQAQFYQGNSNNLPFKAQQFDKVFCVHTLYFWERPLEHLNELKRVIKPTGRFCIGFGDRTFMQELSFTPYGFSLYGAEDVTELLRSAGFNPIDIQQHVETGVSNTGENVEKVMNIVVCTPR
ncbi:MAG: class I SAM-dependent methyltransferase [Pseudomonadales bacterium]|uniref:SAM-dependent methyltransferase n=1 Tax=Oleiphilus messinensis TaxID=141451 RepID=A0A1Y0II22_9GAMM|nr:class I SAM-dependent methyltransferase [Oleiphilus messinensis]ARU59073.1 SAM-dependent methyltransferase [Oleiphilus messinensis]MCG8609978.1 class I SAM-dependent methyltransferase [Pseudomonadales bacterium]